MTTPPPPSSPDAGPGRLALDAHGPWLLLTADPAVLDPLLTAVRRVAAVVRRLPGPGMRTEAALHAEVARALALPRYYGANWSALEDCLSDLSWLPAAASLLVVDGAQDLLADEPPERIGLLGDLLERVARAWAAPIDSGEWWDRPPVPFHVVLLAGGEAAAASVARRWADQGVNLTRW